METIAVVDTAICTDNLGDEIIMDAVNEVVWELFPTAYVFRVPSHEALSERSHAFISQANWCFIGGTNLLSSDIRPDGLWRLRRRDASLYGSTHTVCLGAGWSNYMAPPSRATRELLHTALSPALMHATRDRYTHDHLRDIGLPVIATACPTMWKLTPAHCSAIPHTRAPAVLFTLSAWRPDPNADRAFVEALRRHYTCLYFFPQMQSDWDYFRSFGWDGIKLAAATTESYSRFLENQDVDVVGTRLHGGIRALQKGRCALILAIDNRATEIHRDTGLPVLQRGDTGGIEQWIEGGAATAINLPQTAIEQWKAQFTPANRAAFPRPAPAPESGRGAGLVRMASRGVRFARRLFRNGLLRS